MTGPDAGPRGEVAGDPVDGHLQRQTPGLGIRFGEKGIQDPDEALGIRRDAGELGLHIGRRARALGSRWPRGREPAQGRAGEVQIVVDDSRQDCQGDVYKRQISM